MTVPARVQAVPVTAGTAAVLRRKCDCAGSEHECEECKKKTPLQRRSVGLGPTVAPPIVHEVLRAPGESLDSTTRTFMETAFGHDFSRVRVHTDTRAIESARQVDAEAYTVGHQIVIGAERPSFHTREGRSLLAHELAHTVQQAGDGRTVAPPADLEIGPVSDSYERQADAAATVVAGSQSDASIRRCSGDREAEVPRVGASPGGILQRRVKVTPPAAVGDILARFEELCPGQLVASGDEIKPGTDSCQVASNQSCECACETAFDTKRTYTIDVQPAVASASSKKLHDGKMATVPDTSLYPHTVGGNDPTISMVASSGSNIEFGFFDKGGRAFWYDNWRILAHELCGHGRLNQTYAGTTGCRPGHDVTIDTENAIAAEHRGTARGHSGDPRRGEAFYNPVGNRKKVVFYQCNGLHFEAP